MRSASQPCRDFSCIMCHAGSAVSMRVSRIFINNMLEDSSKQILMVQGH